MIRASHCALVAFGLVLGVGAARAAVSVTGVTASQRTDGSKKVDIYYTLANANAPVTVSVAVSLDNGATWPLATNPLYLSGDAGSGIVNGTGKHIVWDSALDRPGFASAQTKVRIMVQEATPHGLTVNLPNGQSMDFALIPAGTFTMGLDNDYPWDVHDTFPEHTATLAYDFYMGRTEVTQGQWMAVMGAWPTDPPTDAYGLGDNYPIYNVSFEDAQAFIRKLSDLGYGGFRLPSETEWEYACRAGTRTHYYFGDSDAELSAHGWTAANSLGKTHPVATGISNFYGLYDLYGNVWEWCPDNYDYGYNRFPNDGSAFADHGNRTVRGGGWNSDRYYSSSAGHEGFSSAAYTTVGFRLVRIP